MALSLYSAKKLYAEKSRPNVLFLFADQHRASATGCYGDPNVRTPNLDRLAAQGVRMDAAYSNTPVCCPFRACLMTGLYSHHHGMLTNSANFLPAGPLLGQTFKDAGYKTGYIGKWHLEYPSHDKLYPGQFPGAHARYVPPQRRLGFDWWRMADRNHSHFEHSFFVDDAKQPTPPQKGWQPTAFVDEAFKFIRANISDPWFLAVSFGPPHTPYKAPEEYRSHYQGETLKLLPNVPEGKAEAFARKNLPDYYGMIESLDAEVGRLMSLLDQLGIAENTIIVYTSDHGDQMGSHGYKVKRWPHDESARIPFILRYPKAIPRQQVKSAPFSAIDFFPTLAGLAGLAVPKGLDGQDYSSYIKNEAATPPRAFVYSQMHYGYVPWPGWRSLRTKNYLYAETKEGPWLLFDVRNDPFQTKNLVRSAQHQTLVKEFSQKLNRIMKDSGDSWEIKVGSEYGNRGDINNWRPGSAKFRQINLGFDWPGKFGWGTSPQH